MSNGTRTYKTTLQLESLVHAVFQWRVRLRTVRVGQQSSFLQHRAL